MQNSFLRGVTTLFVAGGAVLLTVAANITGTIRDKQGDTLPQASVRLLSERDSSFVSGTAADLDGKFSLNNIKPGNYIVEVTYMGYGVVNRKVKVDSSNVRMRPIVLAEKSNLLEEVSVVGVRTPIKVMEDTVEFNASTYKTQPNAVVEDLLKRLPGVEVDASSGKITANGKEVSKILVDGKEFFSDDPTVASRNLPVNMVDKLQVVDRKSDLARMTGVDDGEDETVINLTVKKGMKNGWFGNVEAGYGTDDRYKGSFVVNRFANENQFTFLGNFNNINELGFNDGGSRFRRFGGTNGLTTSRALGFNFNVGNGEKFRVGGDVMYSNTDRDTRQRQDRQYLFTDSTSYSNSAKQANDKGHNIRADFRVLWKPDSFNTFEFRPNVSVNFNRSESLDSAMTRAGDMDRTLVNSSFNDVSSKANAVNLGMRLIYNHRFRKPGRSFSFMASYNYSNQREKEWSYALNRFYLFNDSIDTYDQYADNHTWSHSAMGRVSWTEPLGDPAKGWSLIAAYRASYRWNDADKLTYDYPLLDPNDPLGGFDYTNMQFNDSLSNRFRNHFFNQDIRLGIRKVTKAYNLEAGLSLVPSMSESFDLINSARNIDTRWVWNFAPYLRYRYKMGKSRSLNMFYMGRSSQPSMTQLQPVADYSDPLRVVIGNPDLDPSFSHHLMLRFQDFNSAAQRSMMAMADIQLTQNSIISKTTFNQETGGQTTTYTNVNGVWNGRVMFMYSQPLRNKAWTINNHLFNSLSRTVGFNNALRNASLTYMLGENFSIAWRPDNVELELRPFYRLQLTHNTVQASANRTVHTYGGSFNGTYNAPCGISLNTDVNYSATSGYSVGYDSRQWMWNAQVSYQFLRGRVATVALKVYDLLQQKSNIRRNVTANYIDDTEYNSLTRYFMVTFAYKFNTFGKGNEPSRRGGDEYHRGGPGGPPPGHGGPGRRPF